MATRKSDDQIRHPDNKLKIGHDRVVTLHDADTNDDIHDCVATLHDANTNDDMTIFTNFHDVWVWARIVPFLLVRRHSVTSSRTLTVAQVMSPVFVLHVTHMCSWSERLSSTLLSPFTSRTYCRTPSTSSRTWSSWTTCCALRTKWLWTCLTSPTPTQKMFKWRLEKSYTRKYMRHLVFLQRSPWHMIGWRNWVQKLLNDQRDKLFNNPKVPKQTNQIQT